MLSNKNTILTLVLITMASLISTSSLAATNLKCESLATKSLKLFVSLSDAVSGKGKVLLGVGSSIDPRSRLFGSYNVFYGKPNTRLAGIDSVNIYASGSLNGSSEIAAKVSMSMDATEGSPVNSGGSLISAKAEFGYNSQGQFVVLETLRLKCQMIK